jgi:hypothetical protein
LGPLIKNPRKIVSLSDTELKSLTINHEFPTAATSHEPITVCKPIVVVAAISKQYHCSEPHIGRSSRTTASSSGGSCSDFPNFLSVSPNASAFGDATHGGSFSLSTSIHRHSSRSSLNGECCSWSCSPNANVNVNVNAICSGHFCGSSARVSIDSSSSCISSFRFNASRNNNRNHNFHSPTSSPKSRRTI